MRVVGQGACGRAEGLIPHLLCPGSHQRAEVTLLDVGQAAVELPEGWDVRDGEKHSSQLPGHVLCSPAPCCCLRAGVNDLSGVW